MLKFLKKVKTCNPQYAGAIVVHCSAGVGRTGTFIVIDAMLDMMTSERKVDVFGFVTRIRAQRCQMVQTDEKCVQYWPSESTLSCGDITIELKKEEESESYTVRDLLVSNNRENKSRLVRQFHFHGWPEVGIPADGKGMINLIAAVQKQQQQSGNHPFTVHCSFVLFCMLVLGCTQEKCVQYWPSESTLSCGDITIELKKEEESESYTVRDLLVSNNRENKSRLVRQFHFHGWPEVGIPADGKGMINLIAAVQKQQQQSGNHPFTVHCRSVQSNTDHPFTVHCRSVQSNTDHPFTVHCRSVQSNTDHPFTVHCRSVQSNTDHPFTVHCRAVQSNTHLGK
ncbi:UNVERIFIED_CONTAM: hypothetical protein FKN15_022466 [Acipenser sinensis]